MYEDRKDYDNEELLPIALHFERQRMRTQEHSSVNPKLKWIRRRKHVEKSKHLRTVDSQWNLFLQMMPVFLSFNIAQQLRVRKVAPVYHVAFSDSHHVVYVYLC